MLSVAEAWLVLSLTNSPLLLGLINMLHWGPILLLALPSGAIADRVAKRRLLMATQAAQACTALTIATQVATGGAAYSDVRILALRSAVHHPFRLMLPTCQYASTPVATCVSM